MSVRTDQTWSTTQLNTTTANTNLFPGRLLPDGNGGLLATWIDSPIVPPGQPSAQSTFRAAHVATGGGVTLFDLPLTPPQDLLLQPNSTSPVNPELTLGENSVAFVSYGTNVASFGVSSGAGGWSYTAANGVELVAAQSDGTVVARTASVSGPDTILQFTSGGGVTSTSLGVANVSHVVAGLWASSGVANGTGAIEGLNIDWAHTGWFQPTQGGQRRARGVYRDRPGVPGHQDAAFDMMAALRPLVSVVEWGGLICKFGQDYKWSPFVKGIKGAVSALTDPQAISFCASGSVVANVHLHVLDNAIPEGYPGPSGGDLVNANNNPSLWYYLAAPSSERGTGPLAPEQYYRYKAPAASNICQWNGAQWFRRSGQSWVQCVP